MYKFRQYSSAESGKSAALKIYLIIILSLISLSLSAMTGCSKKPEPTVDPYEGMVQVSDGMGGLMWVELYDDVPVSSLQAGDFYRDGQFVQFAGDGFAVKRGIDVSFYQGDIDWQSVQSAGIEFVMIRAGYRGYSEGVIYEDTKFRQNIDGAKAAGLEVGVYFFSQAIDTKEAVEEAEFVLALIDGYELDFPVAFDWERIGNDDPSRTDHVNGATLTECALAFCDTIREGGFEPMVYLYRRLGYFDYNLSDLLGLKLWVGALGEFPDFYYEHYIWQYSIKGSIDGIVGDVDLDICFIRNDPESEEENGGGNHESAAPPA